ncbi:ribosomal protein S18-alanine N-acetyltransferase [Periweissella beninensis]|uniref:Ribosomal protein S18-alanine N-acetyltransferase n=1 Tax=Periweissella beninensis TaxID=504936 RepID=A0ABT0VIG2_9LACO|nr:ribosomal protein S18-alanine N-acetyltransferase [Periweissella beninensis]MBM7544644.1 ribosomal-protein-alanine N-acetyltransferase [Periweissella beninensis]MCM2436913.1 ribosomal protein S18-alanine N-acetyltransferase [Periweissella beninensis]MCT4396590.1 ribosomal-protein-alanine N-acetyltransferase [Periweissella beninensis]
MLKKFKTEDIRRKLRRITQQLTGFDEQQVNAMAIKADRVTINNVLYYMGRAQVSDIQEILDIERAVYNGKTPWNDKAFARELHRKADRLYLVIRKADQMIAFIGASFSRSTGDMHITNIAVLPVWQGQGIGTFLLNTIIAKAKMIKASQLSLEVRISNVKAQQVYKNLGFTSQGIKAGYYFGDHEDALDMTLQIEAGR